MYLVLGSSADESATWAAGGLRERGLEPLEWVSLDQLAAARRWEHRVGAAGAGIDFTLADGREIRGAEVRGTLNRLACAPGAGGEWAHPADRDYATHEIAAFFLGWLAALPPPVLNPPTPQGLCGAWRHPSQWCLLAARAGLPTAGYRQDSRDPDGGERPDAATSSPHRFYVVGDEVVGGPLPDGVRRGCRQLARLAGAPLLAVDLALDDDGRWSFAAASPFADLVPGGEALLDALAHALRGGGR